MFSYFVLFCINFGGSKEFIIKPDLLLVDVRVEFYLVISPERRSNMRSTRTDLLSGPALYKYQVKSPRYISWNSQKMSKCPINVF